MCCAEGVVFALCALGKAGKSAALTEGVHLITATSQDFMRIALMSDIPDQLVIGRIKHGVNGHGQLDYAKPCAQVTAGFGNGFDNLAAEFIG